MNGCTDTAAVIPMERAGLCLDCDHVVELQAACPACSSESVVSLARWLNREEPQPVPPPAAWIAEAVERVNAGRGA